MIDLIQFPGGGTSNEEHVTAAFFKAQRRINEERAKAACEAREAMTVLTAVMAGGSGQSYKVRALLFSLWNGKAASLLDVIDLDFDIRKQVVAVILGFGHPKFFYDQIQQPLVAANLWPWFLREGDCELSARRGFHLPQAP